MTDESKMEVEPTSTTPTKSSKPKKPKSSAGSNENVNPSAGSETAAKYPNMSLAQSIHRAVLLADPNSKFTAETFTAAIASDSNDVNDVNDANAADKSPDTLVADVYNEVITIMQNPSLYKHLAPLLGWDNQESVYHTSESHLLQLETKHIQQIKKLEEKVEQAKENAGDMEVLDARLDIAKYAAKCMTKEDGLNGYQKVLDLEKLSSGKVMDALMEKSRIASFYGDMGVNKGVIDKVRNNRSEATV